MSQSSTNQAPQNGAGHREIPTPAVTQRLLIVDDNQLARRRLLTILKNQPGLEVESTADSRDALERLTNRNYSILITDLRMPRLDGMELIQEAQRLGLGVTVIVSTGESSIDEAIRATRMGVYDFLSKPIDACRLERVVQRALRERLLQDEVASLRAQLHGHYSFYNMLSKNPRMHAVFDLIRNVADSTATILIEGETGTGKEEVARAIHRTSISRPGPLIAVNCASLPETLLESELFGHEKGAFTSALNERRGRFELAHQGTLFLDEVGDIPASMQAKLLRVLQERRFERVGGTESIDVDVRIITATNRSLRRLRKARQVPRRTVLPAERSANRAPVASGTPGRYPALSDPLCAEIRAPWRTR